jgi:hypothetical protein
VEVEAAVVWEVAVAAVVVVWEVMDTCFPTNLDHKVKATNSIFI